MLTKLYLQQFDHQLSSMISHFARILFTSKLIEFYEELRNPFLPHKKLLKGESCCEKITKVSVLISFVSRVHLNSNGCFISHSN